MDSRYVYANIRLPILVDSDENLEPLSQYLTIDFDVCHQLPEKPEQGMDYSAIIEKLRELLKPPAIPQMEESEEKEESAVDNEQIQDAAIQDTQIQPIEINRKWFIAIDEIKKNKKALKHNYSAKRRQPRAKNLTVRSREEIQTNIDDTIISALDTAFGSSLQQEVPEQAQDYVASFE
jgi:hypothetical protein